MNISTGESSKSGNPESSDEVAQPDMYHGTIPTVNATKFSGRYNHGSQIGQYIKGNISNTVNIYKADDRQSADQSMSSTDRERAQEYVKSLSSSYLQQKKANPARMSGTCEWFLNDVRFHQWRDATTPSLLHVFANPGCGKSVLARAIIDEGLVSNEETSAVLYYFFKRGQGDQDRAASAVAAMLHQLYIKLPDPEHKIYGLSRYDAYGHKLCTMFHELWDIFLHTTADIDTDIVCILDALDECDGSDGTALISEISELYLQGRSSSKLRFLVTSRPYREIDFYPGRLRMRANFIRFDGNEKSDIVAEEINSVIEAIIPERLHELSTSAEREVITYLQNMENRTYLWLDLALDHIQKKIAYHGTTSDIIALLTELPPGVDEAYEGMLGRSPHVELARNLLSIIIAAKRPLTLMEANLALKIAQLLPIKEDIWYQDLDLESDAQFHRSVQGLCGLLLTVHDTRIFFIHETARAFLLSDDGLTRVGSNLWKQSIGLKDANALWTAICFACLSIRGLRIASDPEEHSEGNGMITNPEIHGRQELHPLSRYAAEMWPNHYTDGHDRICTSMIHSLRMLLEQMTDRYCTWIAAHTLTYYFHRSYHILHLASSFGFVKLVGDLLELGADINLKDKNGNNCFYGAYINGHKQTVQLLLDHDIDLWSERVDGSTMLNRQPPHVKDPHTARRLLEYWRKSYPHQPVDFGIVMAAAYSEDMTLVRLILDDSVGISVPTNPKLLLRISSIVVLKALLDDQRIMNPSRSDEMLLFAVTEDLRQNVHLIIREYHASINVDTYFQAIRHAENLGRDAMTEILNDAFRNKVESLALLRNVDRETILKAFNEAVVSGSPIYLQLLFEHNLVEGKVKTNFYRYTLRRAVEAAKVVKAAEEAAEEAADISPSRKRLIRTLLDHCPSDITLNPEDVQAAEEALLEVET